MIRSALLRVAAPTSALDTLGPLTALQRLYKSTQNSHGILRVAKRALELNPSDLVAANNCASLGLLLTGDNSARRLATIVPPLEHDEALARIRTHLTLRQLRQELQAELALKSQN